MRTICATSSMGSQPEDADDRLDDEAPMTPERAIQDMIFLLLREQQHWKDRDDPHGVRLNISQQLAALSQAQLRLSEYHKVKEALAVLKGVLV